MLWTDEEIRELITLWPTSSASQIASQLHRPRNAVVGKVKRLRQEGVLPRDVIKHYEAKPARPWKPISPGNLNIPVKDIAIEVPLSMQPCSIIELDDSRCRWPLGEVHQVAVLFCGGAAVTDGPYCTHHLRMARRLF
jgi:GcrA cell cycle regulator